MKGKLGFFDLQMAENKKSATIRMSGYIGEKYYREQLGVVSSEDVVNAIAELGEDVEKIRVVLNSRGGSVNEGVAIFEALREFDGEIQVDVVGAAYSIASLILCAGDVRRISKGGQVMIHKPWTYAGGTADDLESTAQSLRNIEDQMVEVYAEITGGDEKTLRADMEKTTFYKAKDAVKNGFCTELIEKESTEEESDSQNLMQLPEELEQNLMRGQFDAAAAYFSKQSGAGNDPKNQHGDTDMSLDFKLLGNLKTIFGAEKALELAEKNPKATGIGDFQDAIVEHIDAQNKAAAEAQAKLTEAETKATAAETKAARLEEQVKNLGAAPVIVTMAGDASTPAPKAEAGKKPDGIKGEELAKWQFANEPALKEEFGSEGVYLALAKDCGYPENSADVK